MRLPARLLVGIVGIAILFLSFTTPLFAQTLSNQQVNPITNSTDTNVPPTINTVAQGVMWGMVSFLTCAISGKDMTNPTNQCLAYNPQTGKLGYAPKTNGLLGMLSSGIAMLYSPPQFHIGNYIGYVKSEFGIVKQADAANNTSGFNQLTPVLKLWIAFRNVAYVLFVIVFVVIGFAIMLRAKIDPRTVMTIENQIPKIIVALVLVSFSYAIAGAVVDLMWLMTYITINLFSSLDPNLQAAGMTQSLSQNPLFFLNSISVGGIMNLLFQPATSVYDVIVPIVQQVINGAGWLALPGIIPCFLQGLGNFIQNPVGTVAGGVGTTIGTILGTVGNHLFGPVGSGNFTSAQDQLVQCVENGFVSWTAGIAGIVAFLIFAFALGFALFRMYFALLKSYALFLIYAIFGPFFIMLGVLPGTKINADNWIRHLLAYSLVFPFAIGIMLLSRVLSDEYGGSSVGYIPPLVGAPQGTGSVIGPLIGFAVILLLPQALTMIQDSLSAPDIKYLPGIGQMLGAGTQAYSTLVSQPWKQLTRPYDQLKGLSEGPLRKLFMNIPVFPGKKIRNLYGEVDPSKRGG